MTVRIRRTIVESRHTVPPAGLLTPPRLHRWLLPLLVLAGLLVAPVAEAQWELYVTNQQGELKATPADAVVVYELSATTGELTFKRILSGPSTQLNVPSGLAVAQDKLFVANEGKCVANQGAAGESQGDAGCVTVYSRTASGNTSPTWIIRGSKTRLNRPYGLVVKDDELFVANQGSEGHPGSVTVYKLKDDFGNRILAETGGGLDISPDRVIEGASTNGPSSIVVVNDELFVANYDSGTVTVHDRHANGEQVLRSFKNTDFNWFVDLQGLAIDDTATELFVGHGGFLSSTIAVYKPDASGAPTPDRVLSGDLTKLDRPSGLVLSGPYLVVANRVNRNTQGYITVFDRMWPSNVSNIAPRVLHIDAQRLFSPVSLVVIPGLSCDYTLKVGNVPVVAPGSVVDIRITAELLVGSGTVTSLSVEGLPGAGSFKPTTCLLSCDTTLTIDTPASTPVGTYTVTVTAVGAPTGCSAAECTVERFVSFPLVVRVGPEGFLEVVKERDGTGTVKSRLPDERINCGPLCAGQLERFPVGTVELTAEADAGSNFCGWSTPNCVPTQPCRVNIMEGTTTRVTACFQKVPPVTLNVTVDASGSGSGTVTVRGPADISCAPTCSATFPAGTVVTLTANPDSNSIFARWGGACSAANPNPVCTLALTAPMTTVTATFDIQMIRLTVVKDGTGDGTVTTPPPGISCGADCTKEFPKGRPVTLTATPDSTSRFVGWSAAGCADPNSPCTLTLTAPTTVTATFNRVFSLTVVKSGTGSGAVTTVPVGRPCRQPVTEGSCSELDKDTEVTLTATATPDSGSLFAGWSQPADSKLPRCGGAEPCRITITQDTTVNAHFVHTPQEAFIAGLYLNVFGNTPPSPPNPGNVQELIVALTPPPTLTLSALMDAFFDGPTFKRRFRSELTPGGYVRVLFRAFLRPEPEPPQPIRERIVTFLFGPLVTQLIGPAVTGNDIADLLYRALLNRPPTTADRNLVQSSGVLGATLTVLSSEEYEQLRMSGISTRRISDDVGLSDDVRRLYRGLLGREPNEAEVASAINQLSTRAEDIEDEFFRSADFQTRVGQLFP